MKRNATPDGGNMESAEPAAIDPVAVADPVVKIATGARIQAAANMAMTGSQGVRKRMTGIANAARNETEPAENPPPHPRMP